MLRARPELLACPIDFSALASGGMTEPQAPPAEATLVALLWPAAFNAAAGGTPPACGSDCAFRFSFLDMEVLGAYSFDIEEIAIKSTVNVIKWTQFLDLREDARAGAPDPTFLGKLHGTCM